ncbi:flavodoxin family protein [Propionispora vibrioides]|jgi:multimeric flavodoxin WrbA|uniref:Multimeric flavodoxin WrbA n=1 Tax=Propionispora vibrioides TaxID=112903 RepID=A0A1H8W560_9FIRM|nr:flavodoxin family protein [Propionispora vibrioides]SEP22298.1 Multimeric flavodoxin WrbA [Propionispora vibrioides]
MKVVAFNGSPKKEGNTYTALRLVAQELEKANIDLEIVHVGNSTIHGCIACNGCARNLNEKCVIATDSVNEWIQKMKQADGIILGSPVYFSGIAGTMKSFLDRAFYVTSVNGGMLRHKVGASVVAVRRSGGLPTYQQLNNFINYAEMLVPTSNYWNVIHGTVPGEANQDEEGKQIMRILGKNMAWLLKLVESGKANFPEPAIEEKVFMNFIH